MRRVTSVASCSATRSAPVSGSMARSICRIVSRLWACTRRSCSTTRLSIATEAMAIHVDSSTTTMRVSADSWLALVVPSAVAHTQPTARLTATPMRTPVRTPKAIRCSATTRTASAPSGLVTPPVTVIPRARVAASTTTDTSSTTRLATDGHMGTVTLNARGSNSASAAIRPCAGSTRGWPPVARNTATAATSTTRMPATVRRRWSSTRRTGSVRSVVMREPVRAVAGHGQVPESASDASLDDEVGTEQEEQQRDGAGR